MAISSPMKDDKIRGNSGPMGDQKSGGSKKVPKMSGGKRR